MTGVPVFGQPPIAPRPIRGAVAVQAPSSTGLLLGARGGAAEAPPYVPWRTAASASGPDVGAG